MVGRHCLLSVCPHALSDTSKRTVEQFCIDSYSNNGMYFVVCGVFCSVCVVVWCFVAHSQLTFVLVCVCIVLCCKVCSVVWCGEVSVMCVWRGSMWCSVVRCVLWGVV